MRNLEMEPQYGDRQLAACAVWAALMPEATEGLLSDTEANALDLHTAGCAACARELAEARRGAAWLTLLKEGAPEPSPNLLGNILAQTIGLDGGRALVAAAAEPAAGPQAIPPAWETVAWPPNVFNPSPFNSSAFDPGAPVSPFAFVFEPQLGRNATRKAGLRPRLARWIGVEHTFVPALQPRLAMTAAMAFFSICLTVNLLGISVASLHAESLRPAGLQRTVAGKGASLLRSFEGNRMVYRVESRVNEWLVASGSSVEAPLEQRP